MTTLIAAWLIFMLIGAIIILLLYGAQRYWVSDETPLITAVNQLLPQTQCAQCGYPGCKPYAQAIIQNQAAINLCPPGGQQTVEQLAQLLDRPALPLTNHQGEQPISEPEATVVTIREADCIGCGKCIDACPVDAIIGAPKHMHSVIYDWCSGCNLCIEPCPVDCIDIMAPPTRLVDLVVHS